MTATNGRTQLPFDHDHDDPHPQINKKKSHNKYTNIFIGHMTGDHRTKCINKITESVIYNYIHKKQKTTNKIKNRTTEQNSFHK